MEKKIYTTRDQVEYNKCSRSWVLYAIEHGKIPPPDAHIGRNDKVAVWFALHKIEKSAKQEKREKGAAK